MANKKNNQNKKSNEGTTMNGNPISPVQNSQVSNSLTSSAQNNNSVNSNATSSTTQSAVATTHQTSTATAATTSSHQRHSSTSSSSQQTSKQPLKKTQYNDAEKINNSGGQTTNFRGSGGVNKDHRAREKDKEKSFQSGGGRGQNQQQNHHQNSSGSGGNQNNRKKDNKNRDHSSQSHRSGYGNNYSNHHASQNSQENSKPAALPSNSSSTSSVVPSSTPTPVPPVTVAVSTSTGPPVTLESKNVQTEPQVEDESKKRKEKLAKENLQDESPFKSTDPKCMDTVTAFQEHDEWTKVEMMCELLTLLGHHDLLLLNNCIEGMLRSYTNQMKPVAKSANSSDPTGSLPSSLLFQQPQPPVFTQNDYHQRNMVANIFGSSHPSGLQPLIAPTFMYMDQILYHASSSTTPSSSVAKEMSSNAPTPTCSSASNTAYDGQLDAQQTAGKENSAANSATSTVPSDAVPTSSTSPSVVQTLSTSTPIPPPETPVTNPHPIVSTEAELFVKRVLDVTSYVYILISSCQHTNRKSAALISEYVNSVIIEKKDQILIRIPNLMKKVEVLVDIGKLIAAMVHHPAFTVEDKIKYAEKRDGFRAEIDALFRQYYAEQLENQRKRPVVPSAFGVGDVEDYDEEDSDDEEELDEMGKRWENRLISDHHPQSSSAPGSFFITKFVGYQNEKDEDNFRIEIHWSDGDCTFTQRSKEQLRAFQHRLLNQFGQERFEKNHLLYGTSSSISSFDEENKKLSTSTSTMEMHPSGERIVPRLARDATPLQVVQYINELSDLPARMMMSGVICEEFNGTRSKTEDEYRESSDGLIFSRWKNPRAKSPVRYGSGTIEPINLPVPIQPFLYSNAPQRHYQAIYPSCSNCGGGGHMYKQCEKPTLLDKKASVEKNMEFGANPVASSNTSYNPINVQNQFIPPQPIFIENAPQVNGNGHIMHHQQQHMIQSAMFSNVRINPPFEPQLVMFPSMPTSNNSGGNGSNSGGNQNSNF